MAITGLVLLTALFFHDNAEFFAKAEEQRAKGAEWEWVGPQTRNPMTPAIPLINEGYLISIDATTNQVNIDLSKEELAKRKESWLCPVQEEEGGVLDKYRSLVTSASEGAVTTKK